MAASHLGIILHDFALDLQARGHVLTVIRKRPAGCILFLLRKRPAGCILFLLRGSWQDVR
jgi:hypothetical protein